MRRWLRLSQVIISVLFICSCQRISIKEQPQKSLLINIGQNIPVHIDKNFSISGKKSAQRAILKYNAALGEQITMTIVDISFDMDVSLLQEAKEKKMFFFILTHDTNPSIKDNANCPINSSCRTKAWVDNFGGSIVYIISERVSEHEMEPVLIHEIGHLFGLRHVDNKYALMSRSFNLKAYSCIDKNAMSNLIELYNLDSTKTHYCAKEND